MKKSKIYLQKNSDEKKSRTNLQGNFEKSPVSRDEKLDNLGLYLSRKNLSRILFIDELYQKIVDVPGVILEFGCRWGQNLAIYTNLRGIYEPYNYTRKVVGFDTFSGFTRVEEKDGGHPIIEKGAYDVVSGYEDYLQQVLTLHETENPLSHIQKFELIQGDASQTLNQYLKKHPETVIAMAYFDMDIYRPTTECLKLIQPHLVKGSLLGFDELNSPVFPGETIALKEVMPLNTLRLRRSRFSTYPCYAIWGE